MNRFQLVKCMELKENDYDGPCIIMACATDPDFVLFFPISKENAKIINYVLQEDSHYDINTNILGIYKTMTESWRASDRYLSGIIMDVVRPEDAKEEILMIRLAISDSNGCIESLVHVSFLHAIVLAAMENAEVLMSDELLDKMMPREDNEGINNCKKNEKDNSKNFPEDKKIVNIAKKIMSGKIKDN